MIQLRFTFCHEFFMTARQVSFAIAFASACLTGFVSQSDEPGQVETKSPASDGGPDEIVQRKRRLEFMKADLDQYKIVATDRRERSLTATDKPVLRYTNPVRTSFTDGTVFLWREGERPLAAAVLSIRENGGVVRELVSLTNRPLHCERDRRTAWTPQSGNLVDQSLDDAPAPDANEKTRLRQMREAAARFRVIKKASPDVELRLLRQPLYRFAAADAGLIDGAVFAFVEANDPDCFLMFEAHRKSATSPAQWRFTVARMLAGPIEVELDGKPLWVGEGYWTNPRSISDPYVELPFGTYPP